MASEDSLSAEDKEFLAKCEELLKDRFTDKDEQYMAVLNAEPSTPPIIENWWVPQNSGRRNDRFNRRNHPYERNRERNFDRRDNDRRGYNDYNRGYNDRSYGHHNQWPRYY